MFIWDYIPESKHCFCLNLCRPPDTYSIRPIQKLPNCQQRDDAQGTTRGARGATPGATPGIHPDGEQPKTALWLCEITWYLYTKGMRGRMKAKQRWFKVTRELCYEWIHHFRHHVQDGHWTGEFAIIIRRLHCFTGSFRVDVRGESGPR